MPWRIADNKLLKSYLSPFIWAGVSAGPLLWFPAEWAGEDLRDVSSRRGSYWSYLPRNKSKPKHPPLLIALFSLLLPSSLSLVRFFPSFLQPCLCLTEDYSGYKGLQFCFESDGAVRPGAGGCRSLQPPLGSGFCPQSVEAADGFGRKPVHSLEIFRAGVFMLPH